MNSSDLPRFDLISEPWLRVRRHDGRSRELGLLDTLETSHQSSGVSGDLPTQSFALVRMLLAVLHRALDGPRDLDGWEELWQADRLPMDPIVRYLEQYRTRFDLFHPEAPFLQVADLRTQSGGTSGMAALIADVPNGHPFFTTRMGGDLSLTYAEAARWLVHSHAFDISGIKSGAVGDTRVKGGRGYPIGVAWAGLLGGVLLEGASLKETLLLNLIADDFSQRDRHADLPAWERRPVTAAEEQADGRAPTGPVDLYTWQSRRIRLFPSDGRVRDVLLSNGEKLTPQDMHRHEPLTAWRRSEPQEKKLGRSPVYMPREHDPERAVWRGLQSLLPRGSTVQKHEAAARLAPRVLQWLGRLSVERVVAADQVVRVHTIGVVYGTNNSVISEVIDDALSMRALLARHDAEALVAIATSCVAAAESAAKTVGNLAGDLAAAAGGDGVGPRIRAIENAFAALDAPFRRWLMGLRAASDPTDVQIRWHRTALAIARDMADELQQRVPLTAWAGREVRGRRMTPAHAHQRFHADVRTALPYAYSEETASA